MKQILEETVTVNRPLADCYRYLEDFSTIEQWDPGVHRAEKITPGPVRDGTEYRVDIRTAGRVLPMAYRQLSATTNREIQLQGEGSGFSALDTLTFAAIDDRTTEIRYRAELRLNWLPSAASLLARPFLNRLGKKAASGLRRALEPAPARQSPSWRDRLADHLILPALPGFGARGYRKLDDKALSHRIDGRKVLLTGPTSGLGLAAGKELARLGADLILLGRDRDRMTQCCREIADFAGIDPSAIDIVHGDLSSLAETAAAADYITEHYPRIDVLINNAGALFDRREETSEGHERALAVNFLAPALLCSKLEPLLHRHSRVINVVSGGLYLQGLNLDDMEYRSERYNGSRAYARAKRALLAASRQLAADSDASYFCMHPGWADTPGVSRSLPAFAKVMGPFLRDARMGADTAVWLASTPELNYPPGDYLWFDRRPHPHTVLPATAVTKDDAEALGHWLDAALRPHLQRGLHSVDKRAKVA